MMFVLPLNKMALCNLKQAWIQTSSQSNKVVIHKWQSSKLFVLGI